MYTIIQLQHKYPWQQGNKKRFVLELFITNLNAIAIISVVVFVLYLMVDYNHQPEANPKVVYFENITVACIVNTIVVAIVEGAFMLRGWKKALVESETLRREKAEAQYAALKNQVNPHFLFNSLNTLTALIRTDKEKAIEFVEHFSRIYRYVLDVNDKVVVELNDELVFINHYLQLQQLRYGNNLIVNTNISVNYLNNYILPLSVQIIVENAIKHNEISADKPLTISICVENDFLVISNNLQKRTIMHESSGIGLQNLTQQYAHLTNQLPQFGISDNCYVAMLPLITE
jgi:LytS/YehU family sensor histidine kinase